MNNLILELTYVVVLLQNCIMSSCHDVLTDKLTV